MNQLTWYNFPATAVYTHEWDKHVGGWGLVQLDGHVGHVKWMREWVRDGVIKQGRCNGRVSFGQPVEFGSGINLVSGYDSYLLNVGIWFLPTQCRHIILFHSILAYDSSRPNLIFIPTLWARLNPYWARWPKLPSPTRPLRLPYLMCAPSRILLMYSFNSTYTFIQLNQTFFLRTGSSR